MAASLLESDFAGLLADQLGCPAEDRAWLTTLVSLFPLPSVQHVHHLVFATQRLVGEAPWLAAELGGDEALTRIADAIRKAHKEGRLEQAPEEGSFSGDFLRSGTLMKEQARPAKHLEALRAVVLVCAWRWEKAQKARQTSVDAMASAIRAVAKAHRSSFRSSQILYQTPERSSPIEDALLASLIKMAGQSHPEVPPEATEKSSKSFRHAWNEHALPELVSILGRVRPMRSKGPHPGGGPGGGTRERRKDDTNGDPSVVRQLEGYRRRLSPAAPGIEREPGESLEELVAPVDVIPVLFVPRNPDAQTVVRFQVRQAIWGRNRFLLPNHPDALELPVLSRICEGVLAWLESDAPSSSRAGLLGLLLQAVTGRTVRSLRALRVHPDKSGPHEADRFDLLLQEGELRYSVFWQVPVDGDEEPAYFEPSEDQEQVLEEVRSVYSLPLVPPVAAALRKGSRDLSQLVALDPAAMEAAVREATKALSGVLGIRFTAGQVRASFAVQVFEQSRDLALTQLLAADSFGQSTAPLSYYAPRVDSLRSTYWEFQKSIVGAERSGPEPRHESYRVGSRLQVRKSVAAEMARAFGAPMRLGVSQLVEAGLAHQVHAAITWHLLGMLVAGLTHRPTRALLQLRRSDFAVEGSHGAALFRDKIVDGAHDPRLVALPPLACSQLNAYLAHLEALAGTHVQLGPHISGVLRGEEPLFFKWDGGAAHGELDLAGWKASLPPSWRMLPANWGRHWCRTKAVELGLRPELVNMQLGHLEAAGYPFTGASPTEPEAFVEAVAPDWELVLRSQGWQLLRGLSSNEMRVAPCLPQLRPWQGDARAHAARQADAAKQWRAHFLAAMRTMRERALADVLAHPELVGSGIPERYANPATDQPKHALAREDFERLRDTLLDEGESKLELGLARASALCKVARVVNRRTGQSAEDPSPLLFPRRSLDNVFFPGMLTAVRQVRAMRQHLADWSGTHKPGPWRDFPLACARVTLALTLFGFCEDPEQISGAIARRERAQRSASFPDLLLVPYGDEAHQVLPLRGIAAVAMAHLASKHGGDGFPGWRSIAPHLTTFLPSWAWSSKEGLGGSLPRIVTSLCETVAAANRFELSPAAHGALGAAGLCTQAHAREQVALLDGDPVGSLSREWLLPAPEMDPDGHLSEKSGGSTGSARSQYLALHAIFPTGDSDVTLPLTGAVIPSGQGADGRYRAAVLAELDVLLAQEEPRLRLQPVVRLLAAWCRDMLLHGTERTATPAFSSIATYLSRIGGVLVEVLGHRRLDQIDEQELEHAYLAAVGSKSDPASAASRALSLQRFGRKYFGLPEIDPTALEIIANAKSTSRADARLVLPSERRGVVACLQRWAEGQGPGSTPEDLRIYRQAKLYGELILPAGARRAEILGLEARDVSWEEQGARIRIRRNASRRLKTSNARRDIVARLSQERREEVRSWIAAEARRLPAHEATRAYLFPPAHKARGAEGRNTIAAACLDAIKLVTGMDNARLHHFRHLFAIEATSSVFLTPEDRDRLRTSIDLADTPTWASGLALPRDLMAMAILLGHGNPKTTLAWYHHLPFLLRSRSDAAIARRHMTVAVVATLLGVTRDAPKGAMKKRDGKDLAEHWLNQRMAPRRPPPAPAVDGLQRDEVDGPPPQRWTARGMASLLEAASRSGRIEPALLALGGSPRRADALRRLLFEQEMRLGRKLVEDDGLAQIPDRPRRRVRPMGEANGVEAWWDVHDNGPEEKRQRILSVAHAVGRNMAPGDGDWIRIPEPEEPDFIALLSESGISDEQLEHQRIGAGLVRLRVRRQTGPDSPQASPGETNDAARRPADRYLGLSVKRVIAVLLLAQEAI